MSRGKECYVNRRTFLGGAAALMGLGTAAVRAGADEAAPTRPNIVFIMADDLGYADLGCYGQSLIQTPNIDRLAASGTRFTQWYAGAPICAPSRCVLMTGKHMGHATVRGNHGRNAPPHDGQEGRIPLRADERTVAALLKSAGYATAITGKWGLGEPGSTGLPNDHGFDEWFGYLNQSHAADHYTDHLWRNRERHEIEENRDGKRGAYTADLFAEFGVDFIRRNRENPFFLYFATTLPHKKIEVPDLGVYRDKPWPEDAKIFAAMVTRLDDHVGALLEELERSGLTERTIVIFTSDNGSALGWEGLFDSSGPLREKKFTLYEGGIRTPWIVRWPGRTPAGAVNDAVGYFADFLPTAAGLAGVEIPDGCDGIDMSGVLRGGAHPSPDGFYYWERHRDGEDTASTVEQAVRWRHWKALRPSMDGPLTLYNLADDIGETRDVAADHPEVVQRIEGYLATARTPSPHWG